MIAALLAAFPVALLPCTQGPGADAQATARCTQTLRAAVTAVRGAPLSPTAGCDRACLVKGGATAVLEAIATPSAVELKLLDPAGAVIREARLAHEPGLIPAAVLPELDKLLPAAAAPAVAAKEPVCPSPRPQLKPAAPGMRPTRPLADDRHALEDRTSELDQLDRLVRLDLERLRGTAPGKPVGVNLVRDAEFTAAETAAQSAEANELYAAPLELWKALGVAPRSAVVPPGKPFAHVAALYDRGRRELLVRLEQPAHDSAQRLDVLGDLSRELTLGSLEIGAAKIPAAEHDRRLAQRALQQAEATLVERLYRQFAERDYIESRPNVARPAALADPFAETQRLLGPVALAFLEEAYARGGMLAVEAVRERPPRSTLELYDPKLFEAGGSAVEIFPAEPPAGAQAISKGALGGVGVRALLRGDESLARQITTEAVTLVPGPDKDKPAVIWRAVWRTPEAAQRAADALSRHLACADPDVASRGVAVAFGRRTALVRGLPAPRDETLRAASFDYFAAREKPVAFAWPPDLRPKKAGNRSFVAPSVGVIGPLPGPEWRVFARGTRDLELSSPGGHVEVQAVLSATGVAEYYFFREAANIELARDFDQAYGRASRMSVFAFGKLRDGLKFSLGTGRPRQARVFKLPICDGRAMLGFHLTSYSTEVDDALIEWASTLRFADRDPPVCSLVSGR